MSKLSETTPTQIVDKNGKQTTVHKRIGAPAPNARVAAVAPPQAPSVEDYQTRFETARSEMIQSLQKRESEKTDRRKWAKEGAWQAKGDTLPIIPLRSVTKRDNDIRSATYSIKNILQYNDDPKQIFPKLERMASTPTTLAEAVYAFETIRALDVDGSRLSVPEDINEEQIVSAKRDITATANRYIDQYQRQARAFFSDADTIASDVAIERLYAAEAMAVMAATIKDKLELPEADFIEAISRELEVDIEGDPKPAAFAFSAIYRLTNERSYEFDYE